MRYVGVTRAKYKLLHNWEWLNDSTEEEINEMEQIKKEVLS